YSNVAEDIVLLQALGINTIRTYAPIENESILDAFADAGIRIIMGFYLDYITSGQYQVYIEQFKDHKAILLWEFGNEYNYRPDLFGGKQATPGTRNYPNILLRDYRRNQSLEKVAGIEQWYAILELAAQQAHQIDPGHPVSTAHGELPSVEALNACPSVDVWGMNSYRSDDFGDLFSQWAARSGKPMYISETGTDALNNNTSREDQGNQAQTAMRLWGQINSNRNICSGVTNFEFTDEWWKDSNGSPWEHDNGGFQMNVYDDGFANEEWWGWVDIHRNPRIVYYLMGDVWSGVSIPSMDLEVTSQFNNNVGSDWASYSADQSLDLRNYSNLKMVLYADRPGTKVMVQLLDANTSEDEPVGLSSVVELAAGRNEISIPLSEFEADLGTIWRIAVHYGQNAWDTALNANGESIFVLKAGVVAEPVQGSVGLLRMITLPYGFFAALKEIAKEAADPAESNDARKANRTTQSLLGGLPFGITEGDIVLVIAALVIIFIADRLINRGRRPRKVNTTGPSRRTVLGWAAAATAALVTFGLLGRGWAFAQDASAHNKDMAEYLRAEVEAFLAGETSIDIRDLALAAIALSQIGHKDIADKALTVLNDVRHRVSGVPFVLPEGVTRENSLLPVMINPNGEYEGPQVVLSGYNALLGIIAPLQVNNAEISQDSELFQHMIGMARTLMALQAPNGGFYLALEGTPNIPHRDISNEHVILIHAALEMFWDAAQQNGWVASYREDFEAMSRKFEASEQYLAKANVFDAPNNLFNAGGKYGDYKGEQFVRDSEHFNPTVNYASDVQLDALLVFGPEQIDQWYGEGVAYRIWQAAKECAADYSDSGKLIGLGLVDAETYGRNSHAESSYASVEMVELLAAHYPQHAYELMVDVENLRSGLARLEIELSNGTRAVRQVTADQKTWWGEALTTDVNIAATARSILFQSGINPYRLATVASDSKQGGKASSLHSFAFLGLVSPGHLQMPEFYNFSFAAIGIIALLVVAFFMIVIMRVATMNKRVLILISGNSTAGKSTFAKILLKTLGYSREKIAIIHDDEFMADFRKVQRGEALPYNEGFMPDYAAALQEDRDVIRCAGEITGHPQTRGFGRLHNYLPQLIAKRLFERREKEVVIYEGGTVATSGVEDALMQRSEMLWTPGKQAERPLVVIKVNIKKIPVGGRLYRLEKGEAITDGPTRKLEMRILKTALTVALVMIVGLLAVLVAQMFGVFPDVVGATEVAGSVPQFAALGSVMVASRPRANLLPKIGLSQERLAGIAAKFKKPAAVIFALGSIVLYTVLNKLLVAHIGFLSSPYVAVILIIIAIILSQAAKATQDRSAKKSAGIVAAWFGLFAWLATVAVGVSMLGEVMAHPWFGRLITWFIAIVNIYFATHLIIAYKDQYQSIDLSLAAWEGKEKLLREKIIELADSDNEQEIAVMEGLLKDLPAVKLLMLYEGLLKIAKRSYKKEGKFSVVSLANDVAEALEVARKLKGWGILAAPAIFLLQVAINFFARFSIRNTEFLANVEAGKIQLDDILDHTRSLILQLEKDQTTWEKVQSAWFRKTLKYPIGTGNVQFIYSRLSLAIFSGWLSQPIADALGIANPIWFLSLLYEKLNFMAFGHYIAIGEFLEEHFLSTFRGLVSLHLLNYLLSGVSSMRQMFQRRLDVYRAVEYKTFGFTDKGQAYPTLELEALFAARNKIKAAIDQSSGWKYIEILGQLIALDQGIEQAYHDGYLYSRHNPYLFNLLEQAHGKRDVGLYQTRFIQFLPIALFLYIVNPYVPFGLFANAVARFMPERKAAQLREYAATLNRLRKAFWAGDFGLLMIGVEIGLAREFAEALGGPMEMFIGPWEGSSSDEGPFRYPILNIGGEVTNAVAEKTGIDIPDGVYRFVGGEYKYGYRYVKMAQDMGTDEEKAYTLIQTNKALSQLQREIPELRKLPAYYKRLLEEGIPEPEEKNAVEKILEFLEKLGDSAFADEPKDEATAEQELFDINPELLRQMLFNAGHLSFDIDNAIMRLREAHELSDESSVRFSKKDLAALVKDLTELSRQDLQTKEERKRTLEKEREKLRLLILSDNGILFRLQKEIDQDGFKVFVREMGLSFDYEAEIEEIVAVARVKIESDSTSDTFTVTEARELIAQRIAAIDEELESGQRPDHYQRMAGMLEIECIRLSLPMTAERYNQEDIPLPASVVDAYGDRIGFLRRRNELLVMQNEIKHDDPEQDLPDEELEELQRIEDVYALRKDKMRRAELETDSAATRKGTEVTPRDVRDLRDAGYNMFDRNSSYGFPPELFMYLPTKGNLKPNDLRKAYQQYEAKMNEATIALLQRVHHIEEKKGGKAVLGKKSRAALTEDLILRLDTTIGLKENEYAFQQVESEARYIAGTLFGAIAYERRMQVLRDERADLKQDKENYEYEMRMAYRELKWEGDDSEGALRKYQQTVYETEMQIIKNGHEASRDRIALEALAEHDAKRAALVTRIEDTERLISLLTGKASLARDLVREEKTRRALNEELAADDTTDERKQEIRDELEALEEKIKELRDQLEHFDLDPNTEAGIEEEVSVVHEWYQEHLSSLDAVALKILYGIDIADVSINEIFNLVRTSTHDERLMARLILLQALEYDQLGYTETEIIEALDVFSQIVSEVAVVYTWYRENFHTLDATALETLYGITVAHVSIDEAFDLLRTLTKDERLLVKLIFAQTFDFEELDYAESQIAESLDTFSTILPEAAIVYTWYRENFHIFDATCLEGLYGIIAANVDIDEIFGLVGMRTEDERLVARLVLSQAFDYYELGYSEVEIIEALDAFSDAFLAGEELESEEVRLERRRPQPARVASVQRKADKHDERSARKPSRRSSKPDKPAASSRTARSTPGAVLPSDPIRGARNAQAVTRDGISGTISLGGRYDDNGFEEGRFMPWLEINAWLRRNGRRKLGLFYREGLDTRTLRLFAENMSAWKLFDWRSGLSVDEMGGFSGDPSRLWKWTAGINSRGIRLDGGLTWYQRKGDDGWSSLEETNRRFHLGVLDILDFRSTQSKNTKDTQVEVRPFSERLFKNKLGRLSVRVHDNNRNDKKQFSASYSKDFKRDDASARLLWELYETEGGNLAQLPMMFGTDVRVNITENMTIRERLRYYQDNPLHFYRKAEGLTHETSLNSGSRDFRWSLRYSDRGEGQRRFSASTMFNKEFGPVKTWQVNTAFAEGQKPRFNIRAIGDKDTGVHVGYDQQSKSVNAGGTFATSEKGRLGVDVKYSWEEPSLAVRLDLLSGGRDGLSILYKDRGGELARRSLFGQARYSWLNVFAQQEWGTPNRTSIGAGLVFNFGGPKSDSKSASALRSPGTSYYSGAAGRNSMPLSNPLESADSAAAALAMGKALPGLQEQPIAIPDILRYAFERPLLGEYLERQVRRKGHQVNAYNLERAPPEAIEEAIYAVNELLILKSIREEYHTSPITSAKSAGDDQDPVAAEITGVLEDALELLAHPRFQYVYNNGEEFPEDYGAAIEWCIGTFLSGDEPIIGFVYTSINEFLTSPRSDLVEAEGYLTYINNPSHSSRVDDFTYVFSLESISPPVWIGPFNGAVFGENPYSDFGDLGSLLYSIGRGPVASGPDPFVFFEQDTADVAWLLYRMRGNEAFRNAFNTVFDTNLDPLSGPESGLEPGDEELELLFDIVNHPVFDRSDFVDSTIRVAQLIALMADPAFEAVFERMFGTTTNLTVLYAVVSPETGIFDPDVFEQILPVAEIIYNWYVAHFSEIDVPSFRTLMGIDLGNVDMDDLFDLTISHNVDERNMAQLIFSQAYDWRDLSEDEIHAMLEQLAEISHAAVVVYNWYRFNIDDLDRASMRELYDIDPDNVDIENLFDSDVVHNQDEINMGRLIFSQAFDFSQLGLSDSEIEQRLDTFADILPNVVVVYNWYLQNFYSLDRNGLQVLYGINRDNVQITEIFSLTGAHSDDDRLVSNLIFSQAFEYYELGYNDSEIEDALDTFADVLEAAAVVYQWYQDYFYTLGRNALEDLYGIPAGQSVRIDELFELPPEELNEAEQLVARLIFSQAFDYHEMGLSGEEIRQQLDIFSEILPEAASVYDWYRTNFSSLDREALEDLYGISADATIAINDIFDLLGDPNDAERLIAKLIFSQAFDYDELQHSDTEIRDALDLFSQIIDEAATVYNWYRENFSELDREAMEDLYGISADATIAINDIFDLLGDPNDAERLIAKLIFSQAFDYDELQHSDTEIRDALDLFSQIIDEAATVYNWYRENFSELDR
ncbi:hypothetical protein ACFL38_04595, partial [Candidatus Omnitrophota bacterium]